MKLDLENISDTDIPALLAFAKEAKEVLAIYSKYGDASKVAREVLAKWFGEGK